MEFHLEYRRALPHFQNAGQYYHLIFKVLEGRILDPQACQLVLDALRFQDGKRWDLAIATVMPTHGHAMAQPLLKPGTEGEYFAIQDILRTVKGYTAFEINKLTGHRGPLWKRETFDREIRNGKDFWKVFEYIQNNPVEAGLASTPEEYPFTYVSPEVVFDMHIESGSPFRW